MNSRFARKPSLTSQQQVSTVNGTDAASQDYDADIFVSETTYSNISNEKKRPMPVSESSETPSLKKHMEENLLKGATTAISTSNKGYSLLQKFGYSGSGGLGKDNRGIDTPIDVDIRIDGGKYRSGIGIAEEKRRKVQKFENDMKKLCDMREQMLSDYKLRFKYEQEIKHMRRHVSSAEKVIYEYDTRLDIAFNHLWPKHIDSENDGVEKDAESEKLYEESVVTIEDDSESLMMRLKQCIFYLRDNYSYCLFCGFQYENNDLDGCPGILYEDH